MTGTAIALLRLFPNGATRMSEQVLSGKLAYFDRLKRAGISEDHARAEAIGGRGARGLRRDQISALLERISPNCEAATKADLDLRVAPLEATLLKWLIGTPVALVALPATIVHFVRAATGTFGPGGSRTLRHWPRVLLPFRRLADALTIFPHIQSC